MPRGLTLAFVLLGGLASAFAQEPSAPAKPAGKPAASKPASRPAPKPATTKPAPKPAATRPAAAPQPPIIPPARTPDPKTVDAKAGWEALPGLAPAPLPPSAMFEAGGKIHVLAGDAISVFDPETDAWTPEVARLPARIGMGAAAALDHATGLVYVFQGGGDRGFWVYDPAKKKVDALNRAPKPVGRGAALAVLDDKVYALKGGQSGEFWVYDLKTNAWSALPNIGKRDEAKGLKDVKVVAVGFTSGFLIAEHSHADGKAYVYAWPDHHVQRYDVAANLWYERTWTSMGFRPNCDGGSFAWDAETHLLWAVQGMDSNALGVYDPPRQGPGFNLLRPRLPEPMHGEGSRAAIAKKGGVKHLYVYCVEPGNRLWRIPLAKLEHIKQGSRAADVDSPFETFHEDNGSSLVRRPGPTGIEGVMGVYKDRFFFMRLDGLRVCDPVKDEWSDYPGMNLGAKITPGVFGVYDGGDFVYYATGEGSAKDPSLFARMNPATKELTKLAPPPATFGRGARAAFVGKTLYVLRGGATRDVFAYDAEKGTWRTAPALPANATAAGLVGSGFVAEGSALYAFPDEQVWKLDLAKEGEGWKPFATLPWRVGVDGGMTALDAEGRAIYVVRGEVSRKFGRVDLAKGAFEALAPDLPDVVSVEGERAVVRMSDGKRCLFVMRGHDSHEIWRAPVDALKPAGVERAAPTRARRPFGARPSRFPQTSPRAPMTA